MKLPPITAHIIMAMLRARHAEDVFVEECKDGPTQGVGGHSRMDAWVMPKSWSRSAITAYEIKVTRGDFLRDNKWRAYLSCCNLFYFAAAPGVIEPSELPAEAGLLECSRTGNRLFVKKKAAFRELDTIEAIRSLESVFRYVLMCRVKVTREQIRWTRARGWEEELTKRAEDRRYGHLLGKRIGAMYQEDVDRVTEENIRLKKLMANYDEHIAFLKSIGFDPKCSWSGASTLAAKVKELRRGHNNHLLPEIDRLIASLGRLKTDLTDGLDDKPPAGSAG